MLQASQEFVRAIKPPCTKMSSESGKALKALASAIKAMKHPISANQHVEESKAAVEDLKMALESVSSLEDDTDLLAIVPAATVASILVEIVKCVEKISESVHELSQLAQFKSAEPTVSPEKQLHLLHRGSVNPVLDGDDSSAHVDHVVIITVLDDQTAGRNTPEIVENVPQAPKPREAV